MEVQLLSKFVFTLGFLFRATSVHTRTPQRYVPDGRVLFEQDCCRSADIFGHTDTVHVHHVLHSGSKSQVHTLPHGRPVHNARQFGGSFVR